MLSNVRERTHVLLVNTSCSHLHSSCATGMISGLATRVTLTKGSRGMLGESIIRVVDLLQILFFHLIVLGLRFKWYTLHIFDKTNY
jgi:hypothetical protein